MSKKTLKEMFELYPDVNFITQDAFHKVRGFRLKPEIGNSFYWVSKSWFRHLDTFEINWPSSMSTWKDRCVSRDEIDQSPNISHQTKIPKAGSRGLDHKLYCKSCKAVIYDGGHRCRKCGQELIWPTGVEVRKIYWPEEMILTEDAKNRLLKMDVKERNMLLYGEWNKMDEGLLNKDTL